MAEKKVFKISDEQIKQMYLDGKSLNDIAKVAQDSKGLMALRRRLQDLGVDTTKNMKRYSDKISKAGKHYTLDEHIFDVIDTEEKAYWLGWYMTDGYNHQSKGSVALRLQARDIEILEKLKTFLKTDAPILHINRKDKLGNVTQQSVELCVCSPYFCNSLVSWGVVQHKVHNKSIPNISEKLLRHFIRGYFDGDGCFSVIKRNDRKKESSRTYQFTIAGNKEPLEFIKNYLIQQVGVGDTTLHHSSNLTYILHYGGRIVCYKILDWLYKGATVYLKRKHDKYKEYCISAE